MFSSSRNLVVPSFATFLSRYLLPSTSLSPLFLLRTLPTFLNPLIVLLLLKLSHFFKKPYYFRLLLGNIHRKKQFTSRKGKNQFIEKCNKFCPGQFFHSSYGLWDEATNKSNRVRNVHILICLIRRAAYICCSFSYILVYHYWYKKVHQIHSTGVHCQSSNSCIHFSPGNYSNHSKPCSILRLHGPILFFRFNIPGAEEQKKCTPCVI